MAVETEIEAALLARLDALVLSPPMPVAWPNMAFIKPLGGYVRVSHVPNSSQRLTIGSDGPHRRRGLLQVDIFHPKNEGPAFATSHAGQVAAWFPADLKLYSGQVTVRVAKAADIAMAMADATHWQVPVTVSYECFA
jgi:hypothetical protein